MEYEKGIQVNYVSTAWIAIYTCVFCIVIAATEYIHWLTTYKTLIFVTLFVILCVLIAAAFVCSGNAWMYIGIIFYVVTTLGFVRTLYVSAQTFPESFLSKVEITQVYKASIVGEVERRKGSQRFVADIVSQEVADNKDVVQALVTTAPYPEFQYGDELKIKGALLIPQDFKTETGNFFDYDTYLAKDNIYFVIKNAKVEGVVRQSELNLSQKVYKALYTLKNFIITIVEHSLPSPQSSLLAGLLIAGKKAIPESVMNDFRIGGVVHIVVLSGYNLTIVAVAVMALLKKVSRTPRLIIGAILIVLFSLMVGETATVVRSVIMALIALFAQGIYETYNAMRALIITAFAMLFYNPYYLLHDPSFQLSFLATFGLMLFSPIITKCIDTYVRWFPNILGIKELFVATVSTQIFVTPFLVYGSGLISLFALPVNILVLSTVPLAMLVGSILIGISWIGTFSHYVFLEKFIHSISLFIAFITYIILSYELFIVHFFASLPHAAIYIKHVPWGSVLLVYVIELLFLLLYYRKTLMNSLFQIDVEKPPS